MAQKKKNMKQTDFTGGKNKEIHKRKKKKKATKKKAQQKEIKEEQLGISVHHVLLAYPSPVVLQPHVCVRVSALVRRFFSQCSGLIRRGATRLTSDLESCGTPRGTPPTFTFRFSRWLLGMVVGPRTRWRGTWLQSGEFSDTAYTVWTSAAGQWNCPNRGNQETFAPRFEFCWQRKFHRVWLASRHVAPQAKMMRTDNADRVACAQQDPENM